MSHLDGKYESLLSWIDPSSERQISWISSYLSKKGRAYFLEGFSFLGGSGKELVDTLRGHLGDEDFRDLIPSMRGAWYQKKYRESNGKQVSFQLPEKVASELDQIARERGCSKTQALRQVISDAAKGRQRVKRQSREKINRLENHLKKLRSKKVEAESVRDRAISALLDKLANEIVIGCLANVEGSGEDSTGVTSGRFEDLLGESVAELEKLVPEIQQIRPQGKTIRYFFDDYL